MSQFNSAINILPFLHISGPNSNLSKKLPAGATISNPTSASKRYSCPQRTETYLLSSQLNIKPLITKSNLETYSRNHNIKNMTQRNYYVNKNNLNLFLLQLISIGHLLSLCSITEVKQANCKVKIKITLKLENSSNSTIR